MLDVTEMTVKAKLDDLDRLQQFLRAKKTREAYLLWLKSEIEQWSSIALITLNFRSNRISGNGHSEKLTKEIATSEIKRFGNELDKAIFGSNAVRRKNLRVPRIAILENGMDRSWHCHIMIERPAETEDMEWMQLLNQAWTRLLWREGELHQKTADLNCVDYLLKHRSKDQLESFSDAFICQACAFKRPNLINS